MLDMPQVDIETKHTFCDGVYSREIIIPAGVCLVGAKHKTNHFYVVSKGLCCVSIDDVKTTIKAPHTGITEPGTKRVIYAIEDTVFTTFHPTKETDIDKIEALIIEPEGLKIANNPQELLT